MFTIAIANIKIRINNQYSYLKDFCKNYIISNEDFDFEVFVSSDDIEEEKNLTNNLFSQGYLESICCYRKICNELPRFNAFLLHAAVIGINDYAYAFCAKSGTGKTTHIKLLKQLLKDDLFYINGDKPIIRIIDNVPIAFGSPWCGKEGYETNTSRPLKGCIFIERSLTNEIYELKKSDVLQKIIHQILIPCDEDLASLTFNLLNQTINYVDTYLLKCNMDIQAAQISYNKIK